MKEDKAHLGVAGCTDKTAPGALCLLFLLRCESWVLFRGDWASATEAVLGSFWLPAHTLLTHRRTGGNFDKKGSCRPELCGLPCSALCSISCGNLTFSSIFSALGVLEPSCGPSQVAYCRQR